MVDGISMVEGKSFLAVQEEKKTHPMCESSAFTGRNIGQKLAFWVGADVCLGCGRSSYSCYQWSGQKDYLYLLAIDHHGRVVLLQVLQCSTDSPGLPKRRYNGNSCIVSINCLRSLAFKILRARLSISSLRSLFL